ncbi:unnamed protein product [Leptosia nina]|uniref:Ribosomal protein S12 n=1 Tax=Leptosia nina TaxID=320188 RepID=A0AAV1IV21_9NEOP
MKRRKKVSGAERTRKSWRYPGDKLNRNLLGRTSELSADTPTRRHADRAAEPRAGRRRTASITLLLQVKRISYNTKDPTLC